MQAGRLHQPFEPVAKPRLDPLSLDLVHTVAFAGVLTVTAFAPLPL